MLEPSFTEWLAMAGTALWGVGALLLLRGLRALPTLGEPPPRPRPDGDGWASISIIVPCRDEADHIEAAARSLLALEYPRIELTIVDDRSVDDTGAILAQVAAEDPRLRVVTIDALPSGWIGKCHALHRGVRASSGEWLVFIDGDVKLHPLTLRLAVQHAIEERLDLLALIPTNEESSLVMRTFAVFQLFILVLTLGIWAHRRGRQSLLGAGIGAFTMVRREAYDRVGGHESLRDVVLDDVSLGAIVRSSGGKTEVALAHRWLRVPYASTVGDLLRVTRKNAFAVLGFSWTALLLTTLVGVGCDVLLPFAFLFSGRALPWSLAVWSCWALLYRAYAHRAGERAWVFIFHPFMALAAQAAAWGSALAIARDGGVRWRGTVYPLAEVRGMILRAPRRAREAAGPRADSK